MINFNAGTLSSPSANWSNSPLSFNNEYSKFNKLFKSVVSKAKEKCFAATGNDESVKIATTQCDSVFNLSQFRSVDRSYSLI